MAPGCFLVKSPEGLKRETVPAGFPAGKKIKNYFVALLVQKNYFRIFRPTNTIISPSAANTSVASGPAFPDAGPAPPCFLHRKP